MRVLVCGTGKTLPYICGSLLSSNAQVTLICPDRPLAESIAQNLAVSVLAGSWLDVELLEAAGASETDLLVALGPTDADNLGLIWLAKSCYSIAKIVALVYDPANEPAFRSMGADVSFSLASFLSEELDKGIERQGALHQESLLDGTVTLVELTVSAEMPILGKPLAQLGRTTLAYLAWRQHQQLTSDEIVRAGDRLILLITASKISPALDVVLGSGR